MELWREDLLVNIFKFRRGILDIYRQSINMTRFSQVSQQARTIDHKTPQARKMEQFVLQIWHKMDASELSHVTTQCQAMWRRSTQLPACSYLSTILSGHILIEYKKSFTGFV